MIKDPDLAYKVLEQQIFDFNFTIITKNQMYPSIFYSANLPYSAFKLFCSNRLVLKDIIERGPIDRHHFGCKDW